MKKLVLKMLCFTPLAMVMLLDTFLPIDYFNHRVWEALCVMRPNAVLKGFFYPKMQLTKYEAASDLDYSNSQPVRKTTEWITDRYGYRKKEPFRYPCSVAVVGDSNMAGSGMTQSHLFSEVLEAKIGQGVYPLAPGGIESVFSSPYLRKEPPKTVIVSFIERNLTKIGRYQTSFRENLFSRFSYFQKADFFWTQMLLANPVILKAAVFIDRFFYKKTLAQYLKARMFWRPYVQLSSEEGPGRPSMLFFQGDLANQDFPDEVLNSTVETIMSFQAVCRARGIRFIFMPIPNKENIYYDRLPNQTKPVFLKKLLTRLRARGMEVIDLQEAYEIFRKQHPGTLLYDPEEAHWNPVAVKVAAEAAALQLNRAAV